MRICVLILDKRSFVEAGVRIFIRMAEEWVRLGHQVTILSDSRPESGLRETPSGLIVCYTPWIFQIAHLPGGFAPGTIFYRTAHLLRRSYDMIYVALAFRPANLLPLLAARLFTNSTIIEEVWEWFGSGGVHSYRPGLLPRIIGLYDRVMDIPSKFLSHGLILIAGHLQRRYRFHKHAIILHGAVEKELVRPIVKNEARRRLGMDDDLTIIGMFSLDAGDEADNVPAFRAVGSLARSEPRIRLLVTGNADYVRRTLTRFLPETAIINPGWVPLDQYPVYLSSCDFFILPFPPTNRNLGRWPNKFGDYVAARRPIISNPTGDVGQLCKTYNVGILCNNEEREYIAAIKAMIMRNNCASAMEHDRLLEILPSFSSRASALLTLVESITNQHRKRGIV